MSQQQVPKFKEAKIKEYKGLSFKTVVTKHPALIPLYLCLFIGMSAAALYSGRMLLKSPDVSLRRYTNTKPYEEYRNKQYKLWASQPEPPCQAPEY